MRRVAVAALVLGALAPLPAHASVLGQERPSTGTDAAREGRDSARLDVRVVRRSAAAGRVSLPSPSGDEVAFDVQPLPVMEPRLAARHPELRAFVGRAIDDPVTTVAFSVTPLGVTAGIRGADSWSIEPAGTAGGPRHLVGEDEVPVDVTALSEPIAPPQAVAREAVGDAPAPSGQVIRRTYRLALLNDPTYAAYFGSENVLAAKVALVTRLNQVYNDDLAVRFLLVDGTEQLNLDTAAKATGEDGPCGANPCFEPGQRKGQGMLDRCGVDTLGRTRLVLANLIGASAYDVGHLVLGVDGGGVAYLGVAGRDYSGGGCTGLTDPVGDGFYVDYVAHELGHQFGANHTFDGAQGACGGNGSAASVEPGSGSSIMAYAGICGTDDLQPHTDPYFSQHTIQESGAYISGRRRGVVEVQQVSLQGFDTDGDTVTLSLGGRTTTLTRGDGYSRAAVQQSVTDLVGTDARIAGWGYDPYQFGFSTDPGVVGRPSDAGFQIVYAPSLRSSKEGERVDRPEPVAVGGPGVQARVVEVARGGSARNGGEAEASGNTRPVVTAPPTATIPVRTPFKLEGGATDPDGDPLVYSWEQDDPGYGTALLSNKKIFGPLFRQFGDNARVGRDASLESPSPGQNGASTLPVRWFPDLAQVLAGHTNADTGSCPRVRGDVVRDRVRDCFSEFLPTRDYRGGAGTGRRTMHFRLTARDSNADGGGTSYADVALRVDPDAGPFRVRSQRTGLPVEVGSQLAVRWAVNGTRPLARRVRILLSTDGGSTWSAVLAERTRNDGKQVVSLPAGLVADEARVMVEARGNYFYDVNDAGFAIR